MDGDDVREPDQPEPAGKTDQQIFDEQIARASGKFVVMVGGVGILAALVLSTLALVISAGGNTNTVTVTAPAPAGQAAGGGQSPQLTGDALGAQLFTAGKPDVGAIGCGSCHTMKAAGTSGTVRPNLDKELAAAPASGTRGRSSGTVDRPSSAPFWLGALPCRVPLHPRKTASTRSSVARASTIGRRHGLGTPNACPPRPPA